MMTKEEIITAVEELIELPRSGCSDPICLVCKETKRIVDNVKEAITTLKEIL
jgi:hypothetical protein